MSAQFTPEQEAQLRALIEEMLGVAIKERIGRLTAAEIRSAAGAC